MKIDSFINSLTHGLMVENNLTEEQAKFMLIRAVQMAYKNGLYSLTESEIVSKSLRTLK